MQYAARGYVDVLEAAGVAISMAATGKPTQNAYAERFIRTLKDEEVSLHDYQDLAEARARIGRFLGDVYMTKWIHSSLDYRTPAEFEAAYLDSRRSEIEAAPIQGYGAPITDRPRVPLGGK